MSEQKQDVISALQADWEALEPEADTEALGIVLRINALARQFMSQAEECLCDTGLSWWQYDVLSALRRQGPPFELSASELASAGNLSSGAMTTRIDGLVEAGLVERVRDRADRRRVLVRLSAEGLARVNQAYSVRFGAAESALRHLNSSERGALDGLLRQLLSG